MSTMREVGLVQGLVMFSDEALESECSGLDFEAFQGVHGSQYGDNTIEQQLGPFVVIAKQMGAAIGMRFDDLNTAIRILGGIFTVKESEIQQLPDVRIVQKGDRKIILPSRALFLKFGVTPK